MLHISFLWGLRGGFPDRHLPELYLSSFVLGQSRVIAVDKEEAAVSLTRENAQRYMGWEGQRASTGELDFGT